MDQAKINRLEETFLEKEKKSIQELIAFQTKLVKNNRLKTLREFSEKILKELENEEERINKMMALQDSTEYFEDLLTSSLEAFHKIPFDSTQIEIQGKAINITKEEIQTYQKLFGKERDDFVYAWHIQKLEEIS